MINNLLTASEVAVLIGSSPDTIKRWYMWKNKNPKHPLAQLLPECIQSGPRTIRFWRQEDVYKLIEFKQSLPHGRNGILGDVTQKHWRKNHTKKGTEENGRKESEKDHKSKTAGTRKPRKSVRSRQETRR